MRKKKCDELRPHCATCGKLGIRCLEYGNKPEYMDGGLAEKTKVEEIKNAIKAVKIRKRFSYHSGAENMAQYTVYEAPLPAAPSQDSSINHQPLRENSTVNDMSSWNSNHSSETEPTQHIQPARISQSTIITTKPDCGQNRFESDYSPGSRYMVFEDDLLLNAYTPRLETTDLSPTETQPDYSFDDMLDPTLLPLTPIYPPSKDNLDFENAILLMHYMDHVLYIQFPFYNDALSHHGRGWVLFLMTTVKPICTSMFSDKNFQFCLIRRTFANIDLKSLDYTALALSSYHKDVERFQGNRAARFELYRKNHSKALIELRHYINNANDRGGVEFAFKVSFCILQLIFCEVNFQETSKQGRL